VLAPCLPRSLVAGLALLFLAGCGSTEDGEPTPVTLVELAEDQEGHHGDLVVTEGVVRSFDEPLHYWIEDDDQHRVELVPMELIEPHLGDEIRVTGRFTFRDDEGRRIEVDELEVLTEGDADPT
jgi:hypothetical protein